MSEAYVVRASSEEDVPEIRTFIKASWARTYDPIIGAEARAAVSDKKHVDALFLREIGVDDAVSFVALSGGSVIGHIGGDIREDGACFVDRIHVAPEWQGKGVAQALVEAAAAAMRGKTDRIELTVLDNNYRARRFYEKVGFEDRGMKERRETMGGVPARLMRLAI